MSSGFSKRDDLEDEVMAALRVEVEGFLSDLREKVLGARGNNALVAAAIDGVFGEVDAKQMWDRAKGAMSSRVLGITGEIDAEYAATLLGRFEEWMMGEDAYRALALEITTLRDLGASTKEISQAILRVTEYSRPAGAGGYLADGALIPNWASSTRSVSTALATEAYSRAERNLMLLRGTTFKSWQSRLDYRVRDSHIIAHGQRVPIDDMFQVGGYELEYPGDDRAPIGEWINCRCIIGD